MSLIDDYEKWKSGYLDRCAKRGVELMRREIIAGNHVDTGRMLHDVHSEPLGPNVRSISTDPISNTDPYGRNTHYAPLVRDGRGEVVPLWKKSGKRARPYSLHFVTKGGVEVFAMRAKAYKGDNFEERAAKKLRAEVSNL